jgi:hypothetical protein
MVPVPKFEEDACLGKRVGTVQEAFTQDADLPGEKAIELPNNTYFLFGGFSHHTFISILDKSNYSDLIIL